MATTVPVAAPGALAARFPLLEPLGDRDFAVFWTGRAISLSGDQFQQVALAIVALDLTHSASGLGAVLTVQAIPRALLMLFGGVATDRFRPRSVMLCSDLLQGLVVAALAILAWRGALSLPLLLAYAALSGAVFAFFLPASNAMVPELVARERLRAANALTNTAGNLSLFLVPPVAGLLVAALGAAPAFGLNALALLGSVITLWRIRLAPRATRARPATGERPLAAVGRSLAAARRDPVIGLTLIIFVVLCFGFFGSSFVGVPALAKLTLGAGDTGVGLLLGARGIGALAGSVIAGSVTIRRSGFIGCLAILGLGVALAGGAAAPSLLLAIPCQALAGAFTNALGVIFTTLLQTRAPEQQRGGIMALQSLAIFGVAPLGYALAGLIGAMLSPRGLLAVGALSITISGLMGLASRAMREAE